MFDVKRRVKNTLVGVLFGLIMVPGSIALHAWNEYRTVHRTKGLAEAERDVQTISDIAAIDNQLDGKLVHLTGFAGTDEVLRDEKFGIETNAVRLIRRVQMYQWKEQSRQRDNRTTYSYSREWSESRIDSSSFHDKSGHENPPRRFESLDIVAKQVKAGAYELSENMKREMRPWVGIEFDSARFSDLVREEDRSKFRFEGKYAYWNENGRVSPSSPQIGDHRIYFEKVPPGEVSLIAKQVGNGFDAYKTSNGEQIERLYSGTFTAAEVISKLRTENTVMAFVLRGVGCIVCWLGFMLILGPIRKIASFVPILGQLTGGLVVLVSLLMAFVVSSTTIAIAWIAVRPLFGFGLLFAVGLAIFALYRLRKKHPPIPSMPPVLEPIVPS
jgi:Transmembrane protein 43